jgi:hypothetical protein
MGNRHPSSFAKRAREAAKRAKKQEKAERKAQRQAEPEDGAAVSPEHDPDIDWSAAVGIDPPPGAIQKPSEDEESSDESPAEERED